MGFSTILFLVFLVWLVVKVLGSLSSTSNRKSDTPPVVRGDSSVAQYAASAYRGTPQLPEALAESRSAWRPPGADSVVQGISIPDGMVYVGERMSSLRGYSEDPALIDPRLRVDQTSPDRSGANLHYWPSYSRIPAVSRAAYLQWLSRGRRDPNTYIGYVFLFFYGIERRVLIDAQQLPEANEEITFLAREVEELLGVYGHNHSFHGYASGFLDLIHLSRDMIDPAQGNPPSDFPGYEFPFRVKYVLGSFVASGRRIPADWAFAWLRADPNNRFRTPARRCPEEFEELFKIRYLEEFGEGLLLKPNMTKLSVRYKAATSSISGLASVDLDIPDVAVLKSPRDRLRQIADSVIDELDSYSRWVGRHKDRDSPAAVALLPSPLARERAGEKTEAMMDIVAQSLQENGMGVVEISRLLEYWPSDDTNKLRRREAKMMADLLAVHGYGIEPDPRFGRRNFTGVEKAVVFDLDGLPDVKPGRDYEAAAVLLRLGATVAAADQDLSYEEEAYLGDHLERGLDLKKHERRRLRAYLHWLFVSTPDLRGLKSRLDVLSVDQRRRTGRFLVALAGADGHVGAGEVGILQKLYGLLGLDPQDVFLDVHSMEVGSQPGDRGPATVIRRDEGTGFAVPLEEKSAQPATFLDHDRVVAIIEDTRKVTEVLGAIFETEDEVEEDDREQSDEGLPGLDGPHSAFVRTLCQRESWSRDDLERIADEGGLMPAGAIEVVNDVAFEICGEALIEGWDPIEINRYAWEEMTE